jgi:hypothetical protein
LRYSLSFSAKIPCFVAMFMMAVRYPNYELRGGVLVSLFMSYNALLDKTE